MATACETLSDLKQARLDLITGRAMRRVRVTTAGVEKDVQFSAADLGRLDAEIIKYEQLCAAERGSALPQRFALRGG